MWKFYAILSAIFAALTTIFAKAGLKSVNADLATAVRTLIVLFISILMVMLSGKHKELSTFSKSNWLFLILSGLATGLSWIFYHRALQLGDTSIVSAIDKGSLLLVLVFAVFFLNEPFSLKTIAGVCLIFAGLIILVWK